MLPTIRDECVQSDIRFKKKRPTSGIATNRIASCCNAQLEWSRQVKRSMCSPVIQWSTRRAMSLVSIYQQVSDIPLDSSFHWWLHEPSQQTSIPEVKSCTVHRVCERERKVGRKHPGEDRQQSLDHQWCQQAHKSTRWRMVGGGLETSRCDRTNKRERQIVNYGDLMKVTPVLMVVGQKIGHSLLRVK